MTLKKFLLNVMFDRIAGQVNIILKHSTCKSINSSKYTKKTRRDDDFIKMKIHEKFAFNFGLLGGVVARHS